MTVFLGESGGVEIRRFTEGDDPISGVLIPEMVHTEINRFAHPFDTVQGPRNTGELSPFITGDRVQIRRPDKQPLVLFADITDEYLVEFFVHVDPVGNIAAYPNFEDAVNNRKSARYRVVEPTENQAVEVIPASGPPTCLANVVSYEFTTERETVDCTSLGTEFRENYTRGLISGQGQLECLWDYKYAQACSSEATGYTTDIVQYLLELSQRVVYGADFVGTFYLHRSENRQDPSIWQEAQCIVTGATFEVRPSAVIRSTIRFVTTGPFKFGVGLPAYEILKEDLGFLLQEDGTELYQEQTLD